MPFLAPRRLLSLRVAVSLLLLAWLTAVPAHAQILSLRQLSVAPTSATVGGSIGVGGDRLRVGSSYSVVLVAGRSRLPLHSVSNGDGSFYAVVKVPTVAVGRQAIELLVDGALVESRAFTVLAPLALSVTPSSPAAGSTVAFSVSGLADGAFSLLYAGRVAFGPVNVSGGSVSGKFVLPTDRPATLPADVALEARNAVGRLVPRVGRRTLSVQPANTSPRVSLLSATPTTTAPSPRQRFTISGRVATNEAPAAEAEVHYYWAGDDGSVQPMGTPRGAVLADGSYSHSMRTPQLGTQSAGQSSGGGRVIAVTRSTDANGVRQQLSTVMDRFTTVLDTDAAIDLNLTLSGSDGQRIVGARVDLVDADEDLFESNGNTGGVSLDGSQQAGLPTQFNPGQLSDAVLGCPATRERQYTDANGQVEFEFDLAVSQGGVNIDGSGPPPQLTIAPDEECFNGPDINTPGFCREVDPAGVRFTAVIRAAYLGYGYVETLVLANGTSSIRERPILLDVRVDRYTGQMEVETCTPQPPAPCPSCALPYACVVQNFDRSANKSLLLPKLNTQGLTLGDPYFVASSGARLAIESQAGTDPVRYKPITDLTPLRDGATFEPATPESWAVEFTYNAGAGRALGSAALHLQKAGGGEHVVTMSRTSGSADCDAESGVEVWRAQLPATLARGFRFPGEVHGSAPFKSIVDGYVHAVDLDNRSGRRDIQLRFQPLAASVAALAGAGLSVNTFNPHARRVTVAPAVAPGTTTGAAVSEYELGETRNRLGGSADYQLCLPANEHCGASSGVEYAHEQFSRSPASQPPGAHAAGAAVIETGTGTPEDRWVTLFDKTIPIFRWYWGIPELLSAEVFADLMLKAEYMLSVVFNPLQPDDSEAKAGGRLNIGILIGVDIDVLFGVLVDAGAAIYGGVGSELVTTTRIDRDPTVDACLRFRMDFNGWLEIGCPIANPFDPTCYIPDIEETYNIIDERTGACSANKHGADFATLLAGGPLSGPKAHPADPPAAPLPAGTREAIYRHPALAIDGNGTRLVLSVDSERTGVDGSGVARLVSRRSLLRGLDAPQVISEGYGIRDTAVTFFGTDQALAVWSESALPQGASRITRPHEAARQQRLRYAVWNGSDWSTPQDLTRAGFGDGQVRLARCRPHLSRADCNSRKATVAFQRNLDGTIGGRKGIFTADFNGVGWTTVTRVDQSGDYNITPALTYQAGAPVVAWVRYTPGSTLDDIDERRLALRRLDGRTAEELELGLPTRIAQPSIAAVSSGQLAIAFSRAAPADAFVGTRQAMHLGQRRCASGCRFSSWRVQDQLGRAQYGERPTLNVNSAGEAVLTFRGLSVGAIPGAADPEDNLLPSDPPGLRAGTGELLQLRSPLSNTRVQVHALSNDGGWHAQSTAVFDPASGEVVAVSASVPAAIAQAARQLGSVPTVKSLAAKQSIDDGLHVATMADLPDLAVDVLGSTATMLTPGAGIPVEVAVVNRGSAWIADDTRSATLRLWWDTPQTRMTAVAEFPVASLAAGGRQAHSVTVTVPVTFGADERQSLRAEIVLDSSEGDLDGDNNTAVLAIGGMPVPQDLIAVSEAGTRFVNLAWTAPADARIKGYRVYVDDPRGVPTPLGSSFNRGFADLTALYGQARRYRVASYSARGIESALSEAVIAAPSKRALDVSIFSNGFE